MRRVAHIGACVVLAASSAAGYYHFVHYPSRLGPYTPIYEKFDLSALVNKTVYFYVSDERPALAPTDSYEALLGQIRQALAAWNNIPTSDLRVGYGGVANLATLQAQTPGGEITFEELPPGVLGTCGPTTRLPQANGFIPIIRSQCILPRDLTRADRTTASESFFNSLVHEIGHGLGLQHTQTSAAMTVEVTRSTTRARPIAADDAAGLSILYPANGWATSAGVISGRVTTPGGRPLHLISVVAVNPGGAVVSALTAPDGAYRIEGLPPGSYLLYAHPLPPPPAPGRGPDDILVPTDDAGIPFDPAPPVDTMFYGGVRDPAASIPIVISTGQSQEGVDFQLAERTSLPLFDVTTYSFPGGGAPAVLPAFLNAGRPTATFLAFGPGLSANMRNTRVGLLGGGVEVLRSGSPTPYALDPRFAEIELEFNPFTGTGTRHLVFTVNNFVYVRPGGVQLVARLAPLVREVQIEAQPSGAVTLVLAGDNLASDSRVYLDGVPAPARGFDEATGRLRISPPPGAAGRQAIITVYNPDGQSSVFVQPATPATYTYPSADAPAITVSPAAGRAGRDVTVEISGINTNFAEGQTVVGFGTPDIVTRRVWVLSPTRMLAVISISARAALASTTVSVTSGLQLATLPVGFRVDAAAASATTPLLTYQGLLNSATLQARVAPGTLATLFGVNLSLGPPSGANPPLPATLGGTSVTLNDQPVPLSLVTPTQINLQIPFNMPSGPVVLRVNNGAEISAPMVVQIDPVAPGLFRALSSAGVVLDGGTAARLGDTIILLATGLGAVSQPVAAGSPAPAAPVTATVRVWVAGVELLPTYAGLAPGTAGLYQINVPLPLNLPVASSAPLSIVVDGQASNVLTIGLRAP